MLNRNQNLYIILVEIYSITHINVEFEVLFSLFSSSWHRFDPPPSHGQPPNRSAILVTALQTYFFSQNICSYWLFQQFPRKLVCLNSRFISSSGQAKLSTAEFSSSTHWLKSLLNNSIHNNFFWTFTKNWQIYLKIYEISKLEFISIN